MYIEVIKKRQGSKTYRTVFVGDRGMLTPKRIDELKETDFKIITALTTVNLNHWSQEKIFNLTCLIKTISLKL